MKTRTNHTIVALAAALIITVTGSQVFAGKFSSRSSGKSSSTSPRSHRWSPTS